MSDFAKRLAEPFPADKIHWRVGATTKDKDKGIALAYIDARDVMQRLDDVVGPENWQAEYPFPGCCRIGIRRPRIKVRHEDDTIELLDEGMDWVWKSNGAGETDVEGEKGQYSDAFKRAAVLWGIGRYLYDLPNQWMPLKAQGRSYALAQVPNLPAWALPGNSSTEGNSGNSPYSEQEEKEMYLKELCRKHNHNPAQVLAKMVSDHKTIDEVIAIYEGLE